MIGLFESIAKRSLSMWMVDGLSGSRVGRVGPSDRRPDHREFKITLLLIIKVPRKSLGKLSSFLNIIIDLEGRNHAAVYPPFGSTKYWPKEFEVAVYTTPSEFIKNPEYTICVFWEDQSWKEPLASQHRPIQKDQPQRKASFAHVLLLTRPWIAFHLFNGQYPPWIVFGQRLYPNTTAANCRQNIPHDML